MMNRALNVFCHLAVAGTLVFTMTGCGIYGKFKAPEYEETADAYGDVAVEDSVSMGDILWREFFDDENLKALIDTALANNADMATAKLRIDEAQASLKAARLAYVPGFDVSPNAAYGYDMNAKGHMLAVSRASRRGYRPASLMASCSQKSFRGLKMSKSS